MSIFCFRNSWKESGATAYTGKSVAGLLVVMALCMGNAVAQPLESEISRLLGEKNYAAAEEKLTAAAKSGNLDAEYLLSIGLLQGKYFPRDGARAMAYLHDASAKGDARSTYLLAQIAAQTDLNSVDTLKLVQLATEQGHPLARHILGHPDQRSLLQTFLYSDLEKLVPMTTTPPMPTDWAASIRNGENSYKNSCVACHGVGALNAPLLNDHKRWQKIRQKGVQKLAQEIIVGFKIHPPRGGDYSLSAEDLRDAVIYMLDTASRK